MDAPTYLPNFAPTYRCSACGAVVTELELHTVWHEHLQAISDATVKLAGWIGQDQ